MFKTLYHPPSAHPQTLHPFPQTCCSPPHTSFLTIFFYLFLIFKNCLFYFVLKYLFGCTRSQLQHSLIIEACWFFSRFMWNLVPWPGIEPGLLALGVGSLSYWTTRKSPKLFEKLCARTWHGSWRMLANKGWAATAKGSALFPPLSPTAERTHSSPSFHAA